MCKVDLGSQIDSVQTLVAQESSGFPIAALASEAFAGPRKKRARATATNTPIYDPTAYTQYVEKSQRAKSGPNALAGLNVAPSK